MKSKTKSRLATSNIEIIAGQSGKEGPASIFPTALPRETGAAFGKNAAPYHCGALSIFLFEFQNQ